MTLVARILLETARLARSSQCWWACGGRSLRRFCLFDLRRRLVLDRIRLRARFRGRIRVDSTAGPDPHETHEQDPLQQACDLMCCLASHRGYLGIAREQSEATTHGADHQSHESNIPLARTLSPLYRSLSPCQSEPGRIEGLC